MSDDRVGVRAQASENAGGGSPPDDQQIGLARSREIAHHLRRIAILGEAGEPAKVGEQDGDRALLAAGVIALAAVARRTPGTQVVRGALM